MIKQPHSRPGQLTDQSAGARPGEPGKPPQAAATGEPPSAGEVQPGPDARPAGGGEVRAGAGAADHRRNDVPGEDAGTLTDEEYLAAGGPDAIDSATADDP